MKDVSQYADGRAVGLAEWARATVQIADVPGSAALVPVSDDASFRRYFRFSEGGAGLVFVDAPPEHEDNGEGKKSQGLWRCWYDVRPSRCSTQAIRVEEID